MILYCILQYKIKTKSNQNLLMDNHPRTLFLTIERMTIIVIQFGDQKVKLYDFVLHIAIKN